MELFFLNEVVKALASNIGSKTPSESWRSRKSCEAMPKQSVKAAIGEPVERCGLGTAYKTFNWKCERCKNPSYNLFSIFSP